MFSYYNRNRPSDYSWYSHGGSYTSNYSTSWHERYYGRSRRRLNYWDRDQRTNDRLWRNRRRRQSASDMPTIDIKPEPRPDPKPKPELPKETPITALIVTDINLNIKENTKISHTDDYECTMDNRVKDEDGNDQPAELVVRRGEFMKLTITFDQPFEKKKHDLRVCLSIGETPKETKGTMAQILIDEDGKKEYKAEEWGAYLKSSSGNDIDIMVHIAVNCIIGEWNLSVKSIAEGKDENGKDQIYILKYEHDEDVIILFNPWCKDDGVYMETTKLLDEYILNEVGCVYRGNAYTKGVKTWNFGMFEDGILDVCLYLTRAKLRNGVAKELADPILVSRLIAQMVNSYDDNGVLVGNWSGLYSHGVRPTAWVGSPRILKQFMKSGPVKYGQCWVFSCLTTTVCRCLGIPCRTVTNFASAHDADNTNVIEKVYFETSKGTERHPHFSDCVWNFHVWNEVWLKRPDLNEGFDGWQVIDATPQEASDGIITCGPCPVVAIKKGIVELKYDTPFVFAEVNADVVHFHMKPDQTFQRIKIDTNSVGKYISTKTPDGQPYQDSNGGQRYDEKMRLDLTNEYKYPEGSSEERKAMMRAYKLRLNKKPNLDHYSEKEFSEKVEFKIKHSNEVMIGDDFPIEFKAENVGKSKRHIKYMEVFITPASYTGDEGPVLFKRIYNGIWLDSGGITSFKEVLTVSNYFAHLIEQVSLKIHLLALVYPPEGSNIDQNFSKVHDFRFRRPDLYVEGPKTGELGVPVDFKVSFRNPTPITLTNCKVFMGSAGFNDINDFKAPDIPPGKTFSHTFTLVPRKKGSHHVIFSFECDGLADISGAGLIKIS